MLITGNSHTDPRGTLTFINDFDLSPIVRMYRIEPKLGIVRAWQGHKIETKWFHVIKGKILVKIRDINNDKLVATQVLEADPPTVLKINPGHYNGLEALEEDSVLMVFSDLSLQASKDDDYRISTEKINWDNDENG